MNRFSRRDFLSSAVAGGVLLASPFSVRGAGQAASPDYVAVVRGYADAMIEQGRDVYGASRSPLFAATLDRKSLALMDRRPPGISGIRSQDRTFTGANPMHDLNLYQTLYALTKVTGEARYGREADSALKWFFEHCQSPSKGLMAWGEHQGWDFAKEAPSAPDLPHEFYRPWVLWDRCFKLAPEPCHRFAAGLWRHQISNPKTGAFSRHAMNIWDKDKVSGRAGSEYPRHGGFYIATWAADYREKKDPESLRAIECLVDSFEARRNKTTGIIPAEGQTPELVWPASNLSLAIDLADSAGALPEPLAKKMLACAARIDDTFLAIHHDLSPGGKGFLKAVRASTLEPTSTEAERGVKTKKVSLSYTRTWETGYGESTDAAIAMLCLLRYRQIQRDEYRKLFLAAADRYVASDPDLSITLYPSALAEAIAVLLGAYRITHEAKYLMRAESLAKISVDVFWKGSPLPRASSKHDHYEAITGGDTLAMELLDFWQTRKDPAVELGLIWSER